MIFIASVEVTPLNGCVMEGRGVGAVVYCFIPSKSQATARKMLENALAEDKYWLVKLEFLRTYEGFKWENPKDQIENDRLAKRAALNNTVVYGVFHSWRQDE